VTDGCLGSAFIGKRTNLEAMPIQCIPSEQTATVAVIKSVFALKENCSDFCIQSFSEESSLQYDETALFPRLSMIQDTPVSMYSAQKNKSLISFFNKALQRSFLAMKGRYNKPACVDRRQPSCCATWLLAATQGSISQNIGHWTKRRFGDSQSWPVPFRPQLGGQWRRRCKASGYYQLSRSTYGFQSITFGLSSCRRTESRVRPKILTFGFLTGLLSRWEAEL